MNDRPIGICEAAFITGMKRTTIHKAMEAGRLMWLDFGGDQVTTMRWLNAWKVAETRS